MKKKIKIFKIILNKIVFNLLIFLKYNRNLI